MLSPTSLYRSLSKKSFVRDIFTMQMGTFVYIGATFVSSVIVARMLGLERYGVYAVALAFTATVNIFLNVGQGTSLLVFFAEEYGKKNKAGMAAVLRNYLQVSIVNSLLLVGLILLAPYAARFLYGREDIAFYARLLFLFDLLDIWNGFALTMLQSVREIRIKVLLEQSANVLLLTLSTLAVVLGYGITGLVTGQIIAGLLTLPASAILVWRMARRLHLPTVREILVVPFARTVPYLGQGFLFAVDKNIGGIFPNGLFFILSLMAAPAVVGIARISVQLSNVTRFILLPQVGELSTIVLAKIRSEGLTPLRMNAARIVKHSVALYAFFTFAAMIVSPFAIYFLYGNEYVPAIPLTLWLMLLALPSAIGIVNSPLLRLFRKIHLSIILTIGTWVLMIAILLIGTRLVGPMPAFAVAYGVFYAMPVVMTAYIFESLLRRPQA